MTALLPRLNRRCFRILRTLLTLAAFAMPAAVAHAGGIGGNPIPINNAGFEANFVSPGCFAVFTPTGWTLYDPNGINDCCNDVIGGIAPLPGGPYFTEGAPEGQRAALVFIDSQIGGGPMGLTQVLAATLETDTIYTLSAQIGNIASGTGPPPCDVFGFFDLDGFPGYQVQLLAGGVVIAQDDNTLAGDIPEAQWRRSITQVVIGPTHPQAGQPLEIRLINLNMIDTPMDPGIEVDFDDIRLIRGCPAIGDLDDSGSAELDDVSLFVDVLLGQDDDSFRRIQADMNCSQTPDGEDIALFIQSLMK